ncbi:MAG: hypothetical protein COZ49_03475 [Candidatus Yonathbacteria bacterium CG_4_10_14_3_um_filter_47_65]|uniref:DUF1059 domain-containing protein n=2 Tax=Parcubacteria group TaxID=1794811 RepID=A0A2M8D715_9BACT|nr:MAG: hypothetical protein AUJ44_01325 [Candidatus Nomurabacteria bacterium CG1_02_47_685]PIP03480.1 MAG: hypothetical protein COX54_03510 [Candidatus Yonathbacteria bacterium CG23_combo_of_CG06-09_8_20_14_all_46_18]PIQ32955.1 MAG: hypothetical protein COW61_00580 [Candidatus Yonathbacteria bacterium CG17_big_fil_post_rev_8_21_14_2_50_46_19]PIX56176.1 MAG: hypothetical protein COZ49_03475 [Candidatus Yonathbacteria bacterium CG_4_10_14_3_um_filter_47_65]PIY57646.1 MAG: hypothetical protein CO
MKKLTCKNVGVECDGVFEADTEDEVIKLAAEHAAAAHNLPKIPPYLEKKCRDFIKGIRDGEANETV